MLLLPATILEFCEILSADDGTRFSPGWKMFGVFQTQKIDMPVHTSMVVLRGPSSIDCVKQKYPNIHQSETVHR